MSRSRESGPKKKIEVGVMHLTVDQVKALSFGVLGLRNIDTLGKT